MDETSGGIVFWPFFLYIFLALLITTGMIGLSRILGERSQNKAKSETFESGVKTTGTARLRFPSKFYLIAMFFVLFDIEAVFLIAWSISLREAGWAGYAGAAVFIGILLVILIYEWRIGALDFETSGRQILKSLHNKTRNDEVVADKS